MLQKKSLLICSIITIIAMSSCNTLNSNIENATIQLDSLFLTMYTNSTPGATVMILKGNDVIYHNSYGIADKEKSTEIDENTFFNIASVSKQFSAVALLKLAQEGKLSLDDSVKKYFPHFKANFFDKITLRHLLSHSSGIPDARPRTDRNFVLYATDTASYSYMEDLKELLFEPGSNYQYMNPTYQLMYTIIEKCSGKSFDEYMRSEIFEPAGMTESTYFEADKYIPQMAHGYLQDQNGVWNEYDYGEETFFATKADGGLYTSTTEFAKWENALKNNLIISSESLNLAYTPHITISDSPYSPYQNRPYTSYGYGWFIEERPDWPKKVYHTGDNGGFQIYAGKFPTKDITVLIFENRNDLDRWGTVTKIDEILKKNNLL